MLTPGHCPCCSPGLPALVRGRLRRLLGPASGLAVAGMLLGVNSLALAQSGGAPAQPNRPPASLGRPVADGSVPARPVGRTGVSLMNPVPLTLPAEPLVLAPIDPGTEHARTAPPAPGPQAPPSAAPWVVPVVHLEPALAGSHSPGTEAGNVLPAPGSVGGNDPPLELTAGVSSSAQPPSATSTGPDPFLDHQPLNGGLRLKPIPATGAGEGGQASRATGQSAILSGPAAGPVSGVPGQSWKWYGYGAANPVSVLEAAPIPPSVFDIPGRPAGENGAHSQPGPASAVFPPPGTVSWQPAVPRRESGASLLVGAVRRWFESSLTWEPSAGFSSRPPTASASVPPTQARVVPTSSQASLPSAPPSGPASPAVQLASAGPSGDSPKGPPAATNPLDGTTRPLTDPASVQVQNLLAQRIERTVGGTGRQVEVALYPDRNVMVRLRLHNPAEAERLVRQISQMSDLAKYHVFFQILHVR